MFVQIITGPVADREGFLREAARWGEELKPGAPGYLGATWGVAPDGQAVLVARFESATAAEANTARPEQGEWWAAIEPTFQSVSFQDCTDVDVMMGGGSNDAGFVQVVQGRVRDEAAARRAMTDAEGALHASRPEILGGIMAWHGDGGGFTQVVYFRSEDEARTGEGTMDDDQVGNDYRAMMAEEPVFLDLPEPHFD